MRLFSILLCLLLTAPVAMAETIDFELFALDAEGNRQLLEAGSREYSPVDMVIHQEDRQGRFYGFSKELEVAQGFSIGHLESYDDKQRGFGIWVNHLPLESNPGDFSWEWYDLADQQRYVKRQGRTLIEVETGGEGGRELLRIHFVEDTWLRYKESTCCRPVSAPPSHVLLIKAGSVLVFPSVAPATSPSTGGSKCRPSPAI